MTKKLLPLLVLAALSGVVHAATPPNTLVVAQGLDDIVSLDPAEATSFPASRPFRACISVWYSRTAITRKKSPRFWQKAGKRTRQQKR